MSTTAITEWAEVVRCNDWGVTFYTFADDGREKKLKMIPGRVVSVLWPDGHLSTEKIDEKTASVRVCDMGREYSVTDTTYGFWSDVHKVLVWIAIEYVRVHRPDFSHKEGAP